MHSAEGAIFPISKSKLPLHEISDYWSREIRPPASQNELYALLEQAWWLGEIQGGVARLEILKRMFKSMRHRDDLGIVFVVDGDPAPPNEELPDGGVRVDIRYPVPVPSLDTDSWDDANCADAFDALAQTPSTESYQEMGISLRYIELAYAEFVGWLRGRGFPVPSFWKPTLEKPKRGRPPTYDWEGVKAKLDTYVAEKGPVKTSEELMHKCAEFCGRSTS